MPWELAVRPSITQAATASQNNDANSMSYSCFVQTHAVALISRRALTQKQFAYISFDAAYITRMAADENTDIFYRLLFIDEKLLLNVRMILESQQ